MRARYLAFLVSMVSAMALLPVGPAAAFNPDNAPITVQDFKIVRSTLQAGAHPRVDIRMRFCNDGAEITDVTGAGEQVVITTARPHGIAHGSLVRVAHVEGNLLANGVFRASTTAYPDGRRAALFYDANGSFGPAAIGNGEYAPGEYPAEVFSGANSIPGRGEFGCTEDRAFAQVKDFQLRFPPGFLGNPTAVPQCPTFIWLAGSCPRNTLIGHAYADAIGSGRVIDVPTSVFVIQTMGLEPARLGTEDIPAHPPGPLPNLVTLRTTGDYGIDSSQLNIPRELGATPGTAREIHIVLCERVPCSPNNNLSPQRIQPTEPAKPFFVNPTSCDPPRTVGMDVTASTAGNAASPPPAAGQPGVREVDAVLTTAAPHNLKDGQLIKIAGATGSQEPLNGTWNVAAVDDTHFSLIRSGRLGTPAGTAADFSGVTVTRPRTAELFARSWAATDVGGDSMEAALETIGCDKVPFDPTVNVRSKNPAAGASDEQRVTIDYPGPSDRATDTRDQRIPRGSGAETGGTYTLSFDGQTTGPIQFGTAGESIERKLEALSNIDPGDVQVSGGGLFGLLPSDLVVRFEETGQYGAQQPPLITVDASGVTGAAGNPVAEPLEWGCPADQAGCRYDHDRLWQASLKNADVTLPPGMGLAPGGGNGLQVCTFTQFGVSTAGKQLDNDPVKCPEGSHVGDLEVVSPALPTTTNADGEPVSITGKAFFGPTGAPGRPTEADPWKLFLLLEGHGLRIKLVGDVALEPNGQVRTKFLSQPEVPFGTFRLKMGNSTRAVLLTPLACGTHRGRADLDGYNGKESVSNPSVTPTGCDPSRFSVNIDEASAKPEQAGAHSASHIMISRADGSDMLSGLKLSLPPGAAGSLAGVPKCPLANAQAGNCDPAHLVGNIKTTLGSGSSLFTVPGKLYLAEATRGGDVASIVATVPAKAGVPDANGKYPIDLGPDVVIVNRLLLREADTGVDVILDGAYRGGARIGDGIPTMLEGVPLPIRNIEITVDREGFFLNPTGCDPRPVVGTFTSAGGVTTTSSYSTQATGCDQLPFDPTLYMIVGEAGKTNAGQTVHPPLTAIVTQKAGEAAIAKARVLVPDIVRPNVPFLNEPNALCTDAQAQARDCPAKSLVGSARVITPVLPFELRGPVHIVQEIGNILPKLYVYLRGGGFEVLLKARNRITGVRTENTFDFVPDVPQSYFELKIDGGDDGLLNNFFDLCKTPTDSKSRQVEATFTGHNGAVKNSKFPVRVEGCGSTLAAARISSTRIAVNRKGQAKVKISCRRRGAQCRGRIAVSAKGLAAAKSFRIPGRKARSVTLKFSKGEVRRLRKARRKQIKGRATTTVGSSRGRRAVTLVYKRR